MLAQRLQVTHGHASRKNRCMTGGGKGPRRTKSMHRSIHPWSGDDRRRRGPRIPLVSALDPSLCPGSLPATSLPSLLARTSVWRTRLFAPHRSRSIQQYPLPSGYIDSKLTSGADTDPCWVREAPKRHERDTFGEKPKTRDRSARVDLESILKPTPGAAREGPEAPLSGPASLPQITSRRAQRASLS